MCLLSFNTRDMSLTAGFSVLVPTRLAVGCVKSLFLGYRASLTKKMTPNYEGDQKIRPWSELQLLWRSLRWVYSISLRVDMGVFDALLFGVRLRGYRGPIKIGAAAAFIPRAGPLFGCLFSSWGIRTAKSREPLVNTSRDFE